MYVYIQYVGLVYITTRVAGSTDVGVSVRFVWALYACAYLVHLTAPVIHT